MMVNYKNQVKTVKKLCSTLQKPKNRSSLMDIFQTNVKGNSNKNKTKGKSKSKQK